MTEKHLHDKTFFHSFIDLDFDTQMDPSSPHLHVSQNLFGYLTLKPINNNWNPFFAI
jgi:hypothetical protein